jgi:uncharacterized membrane protein YeaQ/YmgE (transglycosylase-associated protein family)
VELVSLFVQAMSGAIGGSLVAGIAKEQKPGVVGGPVLGILGGALGGQLMNQLGVGVGPPDVLTVLANAASGGGGGAWLAFLVGAVRVLMKKTP